MATRDDNKSGQLHQTDFSNHTGGINLVDSVFKISTETQAAGGYNFDYVLTGGIRKRLGPVKINPTPDTQTRTLGLGQYQTALGGTKANMRAAGTNLQFITTGTPATFTTLSQDNVAASSTPFTAGTTQQVCFTQFNTGASNILWATGGGATLPLGITSTSKYTTNGVPAPTGSITAVQASGSGNWSSTGIYYWSVGLRKRSTQSVSNAALDVTATVVAATDVVTIGLSGITAYDTTTYDAIILYRSAVLVSGSAVGFTTGDVVAVLPNGTTSFADNGDIGNPDALLATNIPRPGNIVLDCSTLPAGSYANSTLFKNRLVVCSGNTVYLSEVNKSEAWPLTNSISVLSAGPVTALAVVSFTSPQAQSLNELLVIFKEREMWVLNGDSALGASGGQIGVPWSLLSLDNSTGCPEQSLIVNTQGWLTWIDFRGIHLFDGTSKPYYASRLLEPLFNYGGDLDKSKLSLGCGEFFRRENQIVWYLSSKTFGEQKFSIKMDVRLTLLQIEQELTGRTVDACLITDVYAFPVYACFSYIPLSANQEQMLLGDSSGYIYFASNGNSDGGAGTAFSYLSPPLSMGDPNINKQFHKVIVWVQDVGNWNLELDWWSGYRSGAASQSTLTEPISTEAQTASLWDVATWDVSTWDSFTSNSNIVPIVYNLSSGTQNNAQGSSIQLQFKNINADQPVTIHGYSVFWSSLGGVTA